MYKYSIFLLAGIVACTGQHKEQQADASVTDLRVSPMYVTDAVNHDSDDPAFWIHPTDASQSLILGTDKEDSVGGLYVFDLHGNMDSTAMVYPLDRPNNVDVGYGLVLAADTVDFAVVTERGKDRLRFFRLPDLSPIDGGGIPVFEDDSAKAPMGVACYRRPTDGALFVIVSRKENPGNANDYLYQYRLHGENGVVVAELVRKFGEVQEGGEIEAIAVDDELGFVYYSDETFGIRKYYADPDMPNEQLAVFGQDHFVEDREGISIYPTGPGTGYLIVSDQQANEFHLYPREGSAGNAHVHPLLAEVPVSTNESDGSEVTALPLLAEYPQGLFVAMSDNRTFQLYGWHQILPDSLGNATPLAERK